ncbi:MAG: hypothetical protein H6735_25335 [Alphaproteobacteria bacterium]|nr:hypothetical protein [Alphaproteobacteria bacterium]
MSSQSWRTSTPTVDAPAASAPVFGGQDLQDVVGNAAMGLFGWFGGGEEAPVAQTAGKVMEDARDRLDLEAARIELADKFHVIGDGEAHDGAHNTVDEQQFEELAQLYSDIRLGKTDLKFDTSGMDPETAAKFKGGTMQDLASMLQTESGRELVQKLAHNEKGHTTTIGGAEAPNKAKCTRAVSEDFEEEALLDRHDSDGTGNDAIVKYVPGQGFVQKGPANDPYELEQRSDIILYHELTHALHRTDGESAVGQVSGYGGKHPAVSTCDDEIEIEEYDTSGLGHDGRDDYFSENTYRAERAEMGEDVAQRERYSPDGATSWRLPFDECHPVHTN